MLKEGMGRRIPKADILKESRGDLEELNIAESGNLYQQDRLTMERESIRATSHSGFHNIESIKSRISDLETFFYDLNREKVEIIPGTEVAGIDGALYAVKISFNDSVSGVKIESWITLEFTGEKSGLYRDNFSGEIIEILDFQPGFEMQWAQELSRSTKIVKSRPGFLYPELFNVDAEDVFPKDSDIAIIGDPFMAIDRERATIIEYEYADEMLPPILNSYITGDTDSPSSKYWLQDLYFEDIRAMDGVLYGPGLTPRYGNVYKAFVEDTIEQYQTIAQSIAEDRFDGEDARDRLREINRRVKTFINGDWTREEAMEKFGV
ncbi:hypothetical protein KJ766_04020, partial [Patescibacteria group bacterium]|nr:hypothetical protein [Patescibacteria group bacterium]